MTHLGESPRGHLTAQDAAKGHHLAVAAWLTGLIMVVELLGGWWTGSLALLSDAGHMFSDVAALLLALLAFRLALRPPTTRHTYGLHRSEILAALANALTLVAISAFIFREAYARLLEPPEVKSGVLLIIAVVGLVVNLIVLLGLRPHAQGDLNLKSAYLHVVGDLLGSVAVIVAAVVMLLTGWYLADPLLSALIGVVILIGGLRVGYESLHILMEGVPRGVDLEEVAEALIEIPGLEAVHHLHAWSICSSIRAVSLHVVANYETEKQRVAIRDQVEKLLLERYGFSQTTVQTERGEVSAEESALVYPVSHVETGEEVSGHQH